jgi:hypothetical protein
MAELPGNLHFRSIFKYQGMIYNGVYVLDRFRPAVQSKKQQKPIERSIGSLESLPKRTPRDCQHAQGKESKQMQESEKKGVQKNKRFTENQKNAVRSLQNVQRLHRRN